MKELLLSTLIFMILGLTGEKGKSDDEISVKLQKRPYYEIHEGFSPSPISPFTGTYYLMNQSGQFKEVKIKAPKSELDSENGIIQIFFTGGKQDQATLVLISDYKSNKARFYVDQNQDYNFNNDGHPLELHNDSVDISLKNHTNQNGVHLSRFVRMSIPNERVRANWKRNIKRKATYAKTELTEPDYWFRELRFNILSADVQLKDTRFQIGLMDFNLNGLYNDEEDRILTGKYGTDTLSTDLNDNNYEVGDQSPFAIDNKGFNMVFIDPAGTEIKFKPIDYSNVPSKLSIGDKLPMIEVATLDNKPVELGELIEKGKYNYVEFWGTWCKGCVEEIPDLRAAYESFGDRLNIIGLHKGISGTPLKRFIESKGVSWPQYIATDESLEALKVFGFPYGFLIDPKGKIQAFNVRIDEVVDIID